MAILNVKQIRKQDKTHNDNIINKAFLILYGKYFMGGDIVFISKNNLRITIITINNTKIRTYRFFINQHVYIMDTLSQ